MKIFLLIILLITATNANAQQTTFEKVIYDLASQTAIAEQAIIPALDGGYIVAGKSNYEKGFLLRIDSTGNTLWNKTYTHGNYFLQFNAIIATKDSNYVIAGDATNSSLSQYNIIIQKINRNGDTLWNNVLSYAGYNLQAWSIVQTSDSDYVVTGTATINGPPYSYIFLAKLSSGGTFLWMKLLQGGNWENFGYVIRQLPDSNLLVGGFVQTGPGPFISSACLIKISSSGIVQWSKTYTQTSNNFYSVNDFVFTNDGIVSYLNLGNTSGLLKTDFAGNILWQKAYDIYNQTPLNFIQPSIHTCEDSGFVFSNGDQILFISSVTKTDSVGNLSWHNQFELNVVNAIETKSHEIFVSGNGPVYGIRGPNVYYPQIGFVQIDSLGSSGQCNFLNAVTTLPLALTDSSIILTELIGGAGSPVIITIDSLTLSSVTGCVDFLGGINDKTKEGKITLEPNPSTGVLSITNQDYGYTEISITNTFGKLVYHEWLTSEKSRINLTGFANGIYIYKAVSKEGNTQTGKIVIAN